MYRVETHIYHTVNCGLYFVRNSVGILIDGLFDGREFGYSKTQERDFVQCRDRSGIYTDLKALLFTHCHEDHFNEEMVDAVRGNGEIQIYAPEYAGTNIAIKNLTHEIAFFTVGDFQIYAVRTLHDGNAALQAAPHVSFIINTPEESFFLAGDATFREGEADKINSLSLHLIAGAFINPYQTLLGENKAFLKKLDPERLFLIHRPLPEDDKFDIYRVFTLAKKHYPAYLPRLEEPKFDTWVM